MTLSYGRGTPVAVSGSCRRWNVLASSAVQGCLAHKKQPPTPPLGPPEDPRHSPTVGFWGVVSYGQGTPVGPPRYTMSPSEDLGMDWPASRQADDALHSSLLG